MKAVSIKNNQRKSLISSEYYTDGMNESWLQETLFNSPDLFNQTSRDVLDPIIPLCRELPLRGSTSTVYLDILAVRASATRTIECKLWKNPQSRREVVGQILEYGALLQGQSYSDVDAQVKATLKISDKTIWQKAKYQCDSTIDEAVFVDHFTNCLIDGSFDLILAGDGIRSDVKSVVSFLERRQSQINSLHLLEVTVFGSDDERLVVAQAPVQISAQRFVQVATSDIVDPLEMSDNSESGQKKSREDAETNIRNRQFWDRYIAEVRFSHDGQDKPRHGGRNWVKIPYYPQVNWITAYRIRVPSQARVGLFMTFNGPGGDEAYTRLLDQWEILLAEMPNLRHKVSKDGVGEIGIKEYVDTNDPATEDFQIDWLIKTSGKLTDTCPYL